METVRIISCSLLVFLLVLQNGLTTDDSEEDRRLGGLFKPLKIEVFYNPLNSKSLAFMQTQIYPAIESVLGSFVDLELYPVAGCTIDNQSERASAPSSKRLPQLPPISSYIPQLPPIADYLPHVEEIAKIVNDTLPLKLVCAQGANQESMSSNHLCAIDFFKKKHYERGILGWGENDLKKITINAVTYLLCTMKQAVPIPIPVTKQQCAKIIRRVMDHVDMCLLQRKDNLIRSAIERLLQVNRSHNPIVVLGGEEQKEKEQEQTNFIWSKVCGILGKFGPKSCKNVTFSFGDLSLVNDSTDAPSSAVYALVMPCLLIMFIAALLF